MIRDLDLPAVRKFSAHFLEVRVAHVLNREDKDVLEVFSGFLDVGEVRCTTFARFDLGILAVLWCFVNFGVVSRTFCAAELFFMAPRWGSGHRSLACCSRGSSSRAPLDVSVPPSSKLQALESLARLQHASLATATCWTSWRMCRMHSTKLRTGIWTIRMAR
jgi:hypothetical protein